MASYIIYVTYPSQKISQKITNLLLRKKAVACSTSFRVNSNFEWEGKIQQQKEIVSLYKTSTPNIAKNTF